MLTLFSPAKLNLFLHVVGKRPDGYHNLESLFQAISLGDTLHFSLAPESSQDSLSITGPYDLSTDHSNLVLKALNLFRRHHPFPQHIHISLEKRIPIQAGLGGGSSNAATTLWGINELLNRPASTADLIEYSKELGSDITFFFSQGTALCTGRGEIINPQPPLQGQCIVVKPNFGLSTPAVFKAFTPPISPQHHATNDLEEAAFLLAPPLKIIKEQLLASGFDQVVMTGSGTSFFCMGNGTVPAFLSAFPVHFVHRNPDEWYPLEH